MNGNVTMNNNCAFSKLQIIVSTLILGVLASISHFAYQLSGNNIAVGLFNPINESVWEHLKFMFFPLLIWWIVMFFIKRKKCNFQLNTWIVSASASLVLAPLLVILLYYAYTGAFGVESLTVDILLVYVCFFLALSKANHMLKYSNPSKWLTVLSLLLVTALFAAFIVFTFNPPEIPLFYDSVTQTYGIQ